LLCLYIHEGQPHSTAGDDKERTWLLAQSIVCGRLWPSAVTTLESLARRELSADLTNFNVVDSLQNVCHSEVFW
jgi:hypothetical protein